ncbi:MAG: Bug family tripartite tricarboxylate transporter substrate binding protein [Xanthobacteraceae bacterium]
MPRRISKLFFALTAVAIAPAGANAQSVADFYKDKQISLYIGFAPGGGYDLYARTVGRHLGKHIPGNPTIVPRNMEGAGSIRLANFIYSQAPRDGTAIASMGRGGAFGPLFGQKGAQFDAQKYVWIGSANNEVSTCTAWHTSGVTSFDQVLKRELVIAGTGPSDESVTVPKILNGVLGAKFKIVGGYTGATQMNLSMERNETQGRCAFSWDNLKGAHQRWLDEKKIVPLIQVAYEKAPDLKHVPLASDLAKTPAQKQIVNLFTARQVMGRPFFAPPDLPKDRADTIRKAFMATLRDPEFLAEARKVKIEIEPVSGERVQKIVHDIYTTPPAVVKQAIALMK